MVSASSTQCHFYEVGQCASCTLMPVPHAQQVRDAHAELAHLIHRADSSCRGSSPADIEWLPPIVSAPWAFRMKAKMAVAGSAAAPLLTFPGGSPGVDFSPCPLYPALVTDVLKSAREVIRRAQVPPYNVETRRGDIKYVLVTASETKALVRFVLRTDAALGRIREHLDKLDPRVVSVSANIQPAHAAILEGDVDIHLAGADRLQMPVGPVTLGVLPRSFTQTNTDVAAQLYEQVANWLLDSGAGHVWDMFCGVGGFALTLAHAARERGVPMRVQGVELTSAAVESARDSARALGVGGEDSAVRAEFSAADAMAWAEARPRAQWPDAMIVNPPRRGLGAAFSRWLDASHVPVIAYSSCNPETLAADLARMPHYRVRYGRLVDMFPHTAHNEAVVLLTRKDRT